MICVYSYALILYLLANIGINFVTTKFIVTFFFPYGMPVRFSNHRLELLSMCISLNVRARVLLNRKKAALSTPSAPKIKLN
jgi:hypothetical protein